MEKNKKYYKKNYYKNNSHKNNKEKEVKKVTYDSLMHADTISEPKEEKEDYDKVLIMKYIAVSVTLLAIIIGSIILFRQI